MVNLVRLNPEQKIVVSSAVVALVFSTTFVTVAYHFFPLNFLGLETPVERLIFALRWQIIPALMLFAGVATVGNYRFVSPAINPLAKAESEQMQVHLRYLSNTLEQVILFAIASLICATFLDGETIKLIPILSVLFGAGRILFWLGYLQQPMYRALGMGITLYPTALMLFWDAYQVFTH
ncbi:MAPEG family protein [Capilliphycus salinus ALCB114379]|uniref:MAPEG family protein n=1 Tax=Capilliphycus salinus TaxID=2768948 RepID=UPI0039A51FC6